MGRLSPERAPGPPGPPCSSSSHFSHSGSSSARQQGPHTWLLLPVFLLILKVLCARHYCGFGVLSANKTVQGLCLSDTGHIGREQSSHSCLLDLERSVNDSFPLLHLCVLFLLCFLFLVLCTIPLANPAYSGVLAITSM